MPSVSEETAGSDARTDSCGSQNNGDFNNLSHGYSNGNNGYSNTGNHGYSNGNNGYSNTGNHGNSNTGNRGYSDGNNGYSNAGNRGYSINRNHLTIPLPSCSSPRSRSSSDISDLDDSSTRTRPRSAGCDYEIIPAPLLPKRSYTPPPLNRKCLPPISPGKFSQRCIYRPLNADHVVPVNERRRDIIPETSTESEPTEQTGQKFVFTIFDRRRKILAVSLAFTNFAAMFCLSVMAPFFPKEATDKGISNTVSGWIFGVFALTQFLTSPIFGKLLPKLGTWFLYQGGLFLSSGCTILFGFVTYMPVDDGGTVFTIYCFILRIIIAVGCTALATADFTITAEEFSDYASVMFGVLETCAGIGLMAGPAFGGFLYAAWGFPLPFIVIGSCMFLVMALNQVLLPNGLTECSLGMESTPVMKLLRIPSIAVVSFSLIISASVWSILDPILEPRLREFDLDPQILGLLFLLMAASYALSAPIWGWLSEKVPDSKIVILIGFILSGFSQLILAPSPLIGFSQNSNELWLNIVALFSLGIFESMAIIPTFESILDSAELAGLEDNMGTYATVAGLWGAMYALGDFVGPVLGGTLVDIVGFQWAVTYTGLACLAMGVILLILYLYELRFGRIGAITEVESVFKEDDKVLPDERTPLIGTGASFQNHVEI